MYDGITKGNLLEILMTAWVQGWYSGINGDNNDNKKRIDCSKILSDNMDFKEEIEELQTKLEIVETAMRLEIAKTALRKIAFHYTDSEVKMNIAKQALLECTRTR